MITLSTLWHHKRGHHVLIGLLYLALACLITFPLIVQLNTHSLGSDTSDTYEMVRNTWWIQYALQNGQDIFWQSHLAYPDGFFALTFQANLLQYFPPALLGFALPAVMALNVSILLTLALNGWAMYLLLGGLLRDAMPDASHNVRFASAFLGGALLLATPTVQGHLFDGHSGLIIIYPLLLFIRALRHFLQASRWRWRLFISAVFWFWLSPSGHMLQVIYVLMPVMGVYWLGALIQGNWQRWRRVSAVGITGGMILLLYLSPLISATYEQANTYLETTYVRYSMDILAIVSPSFLHPFWGEILAYPAQVMGVNLAEGSSYVGIIVALLMLIGVWRVQASRFWGWVWLVAFILALGPLLKIFDQPIQLNFGTYATYVTMPFAWVQNLPGFNLARTPARFNFTLAIAGIIIATYGAQWLFARWRQNMPDGRRIIPLMLIIGAVSLADTQYFVPLPTREAPHPDAVISLRDDATVRAVFNIPYSNLLGAKDALYYQTLHEQPLIAGQLTRQTPVSPAKLAILEGTLNPTLLLNAGADIVILHKDRARQNDQYDMLLARAQTQLGAPIYEDAHIAMFNVTGADDIPEVVLIGGDDTVTPDKLDASIYTQRTGWLTLDAILDADGRDVVLQQNDRTLHRWYIDGTTTIQQTIPITVAGYHPLTLALMPPCPDQYDTTTLTCRGLEIRSLAVTWLDEPLANPITYEGADLRASTQPRLQEGTVVVHLWWEMLRTVVDTEVRFVHILDESGALVAQDDISLGNFQRGDEWAEIVNIDVSALPAGTYRVHVGWYDFNSLVRWQVLDENLEGAMERAPTIGTLIIE